MAKKKVKEIEAEIEMQVDEESSMIDLVGVIKSEMDDAKDFIHQVGEERAESTEYYLGSEPEAPSTLQSEFISTDVRDKVLFMFSKKISISFLFSLLSETINATK